jgi:PadR family transcriptional regulator, regulatory protein AphA
MTDEIELTTTSYIVLGLLSFGGEATPYDLKQMVSATIGHFWSLPHSQLYAEPTRLAHAGYVTEQQEPNGRRRKLYTLTEPGREAFNDWLETLTPELYVLRDLALLKLFFGADVQALAEVQAETHRKRLAEYEALHEQILAGQGPDGPLLSLELGIRHERETVAFWTEHARTSKNTPAAQGRTDGFPAK